MEPPLTILEYQQSNNFSNKMRHYIPYIIFYILLFCIYWYGTPYIKDEYQFFIRIILFSIPVLFGIRSYDEYTEEEFKNLNKIKYQLIDIENKNSIALVDEDGNVQFLFNKNNNKSKKNNWYKNLKK